MGQSVRSSSVQRRKDKEKRRKGAEKEDHNASAHNASGSKGVARAPVGLESLERHNPLGYHNVLK